MFKPFPLKPFRGAAWKQAGDVVDEGATEDKSGAQVKGHKLWLSGLCRWSMGLWDAFGGSTHRFGTAESFSKPCPYSELLAIITRD